MSLTTEAAILGDRFRLGEEIIQGESVGDDHARIYLAEDLETGQVVAIKILNRGFSRVSEFRARFQCEAAILRSFDHPNIVRIIAFGFTAEGEPFVAMERFEGQTLAERGIVSPGALAGHLAQIADALDASHAKGIFHRDISPDAIVIHNEADGSSTAKLTDFELAKDTAGPDGSQMELTSKQTSLGNAAYLSPEQARGGEIDGRSDVYSLGVTLYQALTGQLPFEGETDFQILLAQLNGTIPPFPEDWSDHANAQAIEAVVLQALAKDPADRPATAGQFSTMFAEAVLSSPVRKFRLSGPKLALGAGLIASLVVLAKWLL